MLLHIWKVSEGGLGDFLLSVFNFYVFSLIYKIKFDIYIDESQPMSKCFKINEVYKNIINSENENKYVFYEHSNLTGRINDDTKKFLNFILHYNNKINNHIYLLRSNIGNLLYINDDKTNFYDNCIRKFMDFLYERLSDELLDRYNKNKIINNYIAIHIRCGDYYINGDFFDLEEHDSNNFKNFIGNVVIKPEDALNKLINININDIIDKYFNKQNKEFKDNIKNNIYVFSDSIEFKYKLFNVTGFKSFNIVPFHISFSANEEGIINSFLEFLLIGNSNLIISLNNKKRFSNFSLVSSLLFNKHIFVNNDISNNDYDEYDKFKIIDYYYFNT